MPTHANPVPRLPNLPRLSHLAHCPRLLATTALAAMAALTGAAQAQVSTLQFQQGLAGYTGAADTQVRGADPTINYGAELEIGVDASDGGFPTQSLLRFDNLFGNAAGQIPPGSVIVGATLTLTITSEGSGIRFHEMLQAWNANTITWNSAANGLQANGIEAAAQPLFTVGANDGGGNIPSGTLVIDFSSAVQRLQSGAGGSLGWALLPWTPDGTNGVDFYSAEWDTLAERPLLTVQISPVPEAGSAAMLLAGLLGLGALAARKPAARRRG